jgi:hypothetical protein
MEIDTIELEFCLEEEKKKCLKNIQNYYRKYGCEPVQKLQEYLLSLQDSQSEEEKEYIKKELERLDTYS